MDEDEFGDDDLDAIPANTLLALEHSAITSTQRSKSNAGPAARQPLIQTYNAPGLSRSGKHASKAPFRAPQPRKQSGRSQAENAPPASAPEQPSSDYGFDDEDVIDLDEPSTVIQPASALPSRGRTEPPSLPAARNARYVAKAPLDPETEAAFAAADAEMGAPNPEQWTHAPHLQPPQNDGIDVSTLQARIAELEAEQERLRRAEQEARDAALAKQGEISIVRKNQEKATKEYERRIAVMQKLHSDESTRQKAELEAGRKEREKIQTDNRFLQHDLAQEAERAKRLTGPGKARAAAGEKAKETPKKTRHIPLADGFEEDELKIVSPSKSKEKSREHTPKVGAKRKRPAQDSPIAPLTFAPPAKPTEKDRLEEAKALFEQQSKVAAAKERARYDFVQRLLKHCPYEGHERSVESLMKYRLPSSAEASLSSMLMDAMTSPTGHDGDYLPLRLARIALRLWSRCVEEKCYPPIYLLLDLVRFALKLELSATTVQSLDEGVPICIRTIELVAMPIARASINPTYASGDEYKSMQSSIAPHIDVDEVLDFLHHLCGAASLSSLRITTFWQKMEFEFTLLMLNKAQPISQITTGLHILSTSALATTFGCIGPQDVDGASAKQVKHERALIDRLSSMLFYIPEVPQDEPQYTDDEIAELRIETLKVFKAMCFTNHGGLLLAQHRSAIGRMIRFLDGQMNRLYNTRPTVGLPPRPNNEPTTYDLIARTINMTVRLLYHLLRTYDSSIDLLQKVNAVKGGYHKFLVSMTRIAFSDQLILEAGIESEVVEAAHSILDSMLSPEEGEAVVKAVETPRGTRSTHTGDTTEANTEDEAMEEPG